MSNPHGIEFVDGERAVAPDFVAWQDRSYHALMQRIASLYPTTRASQIAADSNRWSGASSAQMAQAGVAFGFDVSAGGGLSVNVIDGEALVPDPTISGAVSDESPYRLLKLDRASAGLGTLNLALAAAPVTVGQSRIDVVYAQYGTEQRTSEQEQRPVRQSTGAWLSTPVNKRTRPAAVLAVATGVPATNPTVPGIPAGALPIAYVRVANGDTAPSKIADARAFLSTVPQAHGVLEGGSLTYVSPTTLRVQRGLLAIGGELVGLSADFDFTVSGRLGSGVTLAGPGWRYVYAYRTNRVNGGELDVAVTTVAPTVDGRPSATALPGDSVAIAIGAAGWKSSMLYVGCFYLDGSNAILPFSRRGDRVIFQARQPLTAPASVAFLSGGTGSSGPTAVAALLPSHCSRAIVESTARIGDSDGTTSTGGAGDLPWGTVTLYSDAGGTKQEAQLGASRTNTAGGARGNGDGRRNEVRVSEVETTGGSFYASLFGAGVASATAAKIEAVLNQVGFVESLSSPGL